jgi:hypothetical protein
MRRLAILAATLVAALCVAAPANAYLSVQNASNECMKRVYPYGAWALGVSNPIGYHPTAAHRYSSTNVAVRVRLQRSYSDPLFRFYNCNISGNDSGAYVAVTGWIGWAAPDANIYLYSIPDWPNRFHPFVDYVTGQPW